MIELLSYISEDNIVELNSRNYDEYTPILIRHCLPDINKDEQDKIIVSVKYHHKKKGLDLTKGFALIHHRLDSIERIRLSIGLFPERNEKVKKQHALAVFCIIIPDTKSRTYLSLMAHLTRLLSQPEAQDVFRKGHQKEIVDFISRFEESRG